MGVIVRHFGGGEALFTGAGILIIATLAPFLARRRKLRMAAAPTTLVGAAVVVFAAAALPAWFYALWGILILAWLVAESNESEREAAVRLGLTSEPECAMACPLSDTGERLLRRPVLAWYTPSESLIGV